MGGMGTSSSTNTMMPWAKYVPSYVSQGLQSEFPTLMANANQGLTPQEKAYYTGQDTKAIDAQTAGAQTSLNESMARSGVAPNSGAATEANANLQRAKVGGIATAMNSLTGQDIATKQQNLQNLFQGMGIPGSPAVSGGTQTASPMSMISSACCFIFIEAHGGVLHPIVRRYRDEHMTVRNRRGYCWLADRLVPLMQRSKSVHKLVEWCMVDPMTSYGKWFYGEGHVGVVFAPVVKVWLKVFDLLGHRKPYTRRGTHEVV